MTTIRSVLAVLTLGLLVACGGGGDTPDPGTEGAGPPIVGPYRGMYSYMADVALFTECGTGLTYAVAFERDAAALERAYLQLQTGPGEPLLVTLRGYVEPRPGADGGTEASLIVTVFETVFLGQACAAAATGQPLEGPEWTALDLRGSRPSGDEPPTLTLDPGEGLIAWSGCAEFTGAYRLRGAQLQFSAIDAPSTGCTGTLAGIEQVFMEVLRGTGSYEIRGDTLKLVGETGLLATFTWR